MVALQASFKGKEDLLSDATFLADNSGQSTLMADSGTAVLVARHAGLCLYHLAHTKLI